MNVIKQMVSAAQLISTEVLKPKVAHRKNSLIINA